MDINAIKEGELRVGAADDLVIHSGDRLCPDGCNCFDCAELCGKLTPERRSDYNLGVIHGKQEGIAFAQKQMLKYLLEKEAQAQDWKAERDQDARNDLPEQSPLKPVGRGSWWRK